MWNKALYAAAGLSLIAAMMHVWVMPEHFKEWWGSGLFFAFAAVAQGFFAIALLSWPGRPLFVIGSVGIFAIIGLYLISRTVGVSFLGPNPGVAEAVGAMGVVSKAVEVTLIIVLIALFRAPKGLSAPMDGLLGATASPEATLSKATATK